MLEFFADICTWLSFVILGATVGTCFGMMIRDDDRDARFGWLWAFIASGIVLTSMIIHVVEIYRLGGSPL